MPPSASPSAADFLYIRTRITSAHGRFGNGIARLKQNGRLSTWKFAPNASAAQEGTKYKLKCLRCNLLSRLKT